MQKKARDNTHSPEQHALSRRDVLVGAAATAMVAAAGPVFAGIGRPASRAAAGDMPALPGRRYMAASVMLSDGRILISGGYDRPWTNGVAPLAMNSVIIFDPRREMWSQATPMAIRRARHTAVLLQDGRVAVLGGLGTIPTASVEIYDPGSDTWQTADPMAQPRFDHTAVSDGLTVYVLGGSSQSMLAGVETLRF